MATIKAAVVQLSISDLSRYSWPELEKKLIFLFSQGTESGADLIVFPALTALLFSPESRKTIEYGVDQKTSQLVARLGGFWTGEWLDFFTTLARNHRVQVVPGTTLEATDKGLLHQGYLVDRDGKLVLAQQQIHFSTLDLGKGFQSGEQISTAETDQGTIGLVLGGDAWIPEMGRILTLQGADIIISLQAISNFYDYRKQLLGVWQIAQSNGVFTLESCMVGRAIKFAYQGLTTICGPASLYPPTGILAHIDPLLTNLTSLDLGYLISPQKEKEGVLIRNLDLAAAKDFRDAAGLLAATNIHWGSTGGDLGDYAEKSN